MLFTIAFGAMLLLVGTLIFRALRLILEEALDVGRYVRPEGKAMLAQVLAGLASLIAAGFLLLALGSADRGSGELVVAVATIIATAFFLRTWHDEFVALMNRTDDEFPGRFDKLIWALALIVVAPAGVWFFRSFRKARWPETRTSTSTKPEPHELGAAPDAL